MVLIDHSFSDKKPTWNDYREAPKTEYGRSFLAKRLVAVGFLSTWRTFSVRNASKAKCQHRKCATYRTPQKHLSILVSIIKLFSIKYISYIRKILDNLWLLIKSLCGKAYVNFELWKTQTYKWYPCSGQLSSPCTDENI